MLRTDEQVATVSNVNIRSENHGDDKVTGCDINVSWDAPAKVLDSFDKRLRDAFYTDDAPSKAQRSLPGAASDGDGPFLKFNGLLGPLTIKSEWPGYKVGIKWGDIASTVDVELGGVKVCKIKAEPKEGGTVGFSAQLQCHPKKEDYGDLALLLQKEIRLTLTPPTLAELKKIEKKAKKDEPKDED